MSGSQQLTMTPTSPITRRAGVYQIRNLNNGKILVGSSNNLRRRWTQHRYHLRKGSHGNPYLQASWKKHGEDAFIFETLIYCNLTMCSYYEQALLDLGRTDYNMTPSAYVGMPGHRRSKEFLDSLSKRMLGNKHALGNKNHLGHKHSEESRAKIAAGRNKNPPVWSEEARERASKRMIGNRHTVGNKNHLGHKHSEEIRNKMRDAWVRRKSRVSSNLGGTDGTDARQRT